MASAVDISSLLQYQNRWWSDPRFRVARVYANRRDVFPRVLSYAGDLNIGRAALLLGPRQVGKTTLLLQMVDELLDRGWPPANVIFFDFADDRLLAAISPRDVTEAKPPGLRADWPRVFLFDEIQESLAWQRWLKSAVDDSRRTPKSERGIFIATGSSAGTLSDGTIESGQGRWDEIPIEGLSYGEFLKLNARAIDGVVETAEQVSARDPSAFDRYLLTGGFPEHARSALVQNPLPRIRQDIIERALLRDLRRSGTEIDRVKRLFIYLVADSGAIWHRRNRAHDMGANEKSLDDWLDLLEGTRLIWRLEPDRQPPMKAATQLRPRKKIYAADHGLVTAMSSLADPLADPDVRGSVLEAAVFRHLRDVARSTNAELSYFRRSDDLEIDFVLRPARGQAIAIEVTSSARARGKIGRLTKAAGAARIDRRVLVYDGLVEGTLEGIERISAHRFLSDPAQALETLG